MNDKENVGEAWIRVLGLPLHLWRQKVLKKIKDSCGAFLAIDKETALRVKVSWARILVKLGGIARDQVLLRFWKGRGASSFGSGGSCH